MSGMPPGQQMQGFSQGQGFPQGQDFPQDQGSPQGQAANLGPGPFLIIVRGLHRSWSWKDLKDFIRTVTDHELRTDMAGEEGHIRLRRGKEAANVYNFLTNRSNASGDAFLQVYLWEISNPHAKPRFLRTNCTRKHGQDFLNEQLSQAARYAGDIGAFKADTPIQAQPTLSPARTYSKPLGVSYTNAPQLPHTGAEQTALAQSFGGLNLQQQDPSQWQKVLPLTKAYSMPTAVPYPNVPHQPRPSHNQSQHVALMQSLAYAQTLANMQQEQQHLAGMVDTQRPIQGAFTQQVPAYQTFASGQTSHMPVYGLSSSGTPVNVSGGFAVTEKRGVFVQNLPYKTTREQIVAEFKKVGQIVSCELQYNSETSKSKGNASVLFASAAEATKAIETYDRQRGDLGQEVFRRSITVREDKERITVAPPPSASISKQSANGQPLIVDGSGWSGKGQQ